MNRLLGMTFGAILAVGVVHAEDKEPVAASFEELLGSLTGSPADGAASRISTLRHANERVLQALTIGQIPLHEAEPLIVTSPVRSALHEAVVLLGRMNMMPAAIRAVEVAPDDPRSVSTLLTVVELVGNERDLLSAVAATEHLEDADTGTGTLLSELQQAVQGVLDRNPHSLATLHSLFRERSTSARVVLVRAVSASSSAERRAWLLDHLHLQRAVDLTILSALARPAKLRTPMFDRGLDGLAAYFDDEDLQFRREAARAAGAIGDSSLLRGLTELLEDPAEPVRGPAQIALQSITGLGFGPAPARWRAWLDAEELWFAEEAENLLESLDSPYEEVVHQAIEALASHRFRRDELVLGLEPLLEHRSSAVAVRACEAMSRLGSTAAIEALVATLASKDNARASAAHAALVSLTGWDLPPSVEEWAAALPAEVH